MNIDGIFPLPTKPTARTKFPELAAVTNPGHSVSGSQPLRVRTPVPAPLNLFDTVLASTPNRSATSASDAREWYNARASARSPSGSVRWRAPQLPKWPFAGRPVSSPKTTAERSTTPLFSRAFAMATTTRV